MLRRLSVALFVFLGLGHLRAAPPPGYYDSSQGKSGPALRQALHDIINDHHVIPYSGGATDVTAALKVLDHDLDNSNNVVLIYSGRSDPQTKFNAADGWNREHLWCNSYGLDSVEPAFSDLFNLRPEDVNVNSARGNKFFDTSDPDDRNYSAPATPEALLATTDTDSWEPPEAVKGAIARSMFYMDVRYEGDRANEQDLKLSDATSEITSSTNLMGRLQTLLEWHQSHPVDEAERLRNDLIFQNYQGNRNPFIDHPEWVVLIFNSDAPVITNQPQSLAVELGETATFAVGASGVGPLSYEWRFNGTNLAGAGSNTFTITNVQSSDLGSYSVLVSNPVGTVLSASATLSLKSIAGLIPITGDSLTENFDSMGFGTKTTKTPPGWYVGTGSGAISGTTVLVGSGSSLTSENYNFGGGTDRALGSLAANSTQRVTEGRFINDTGLFIISFTISYTGEQWRVGGTGSVNNVLVMLFKSLTARNFIDLGSQFNFHTPVDSGTAGALDGNSPANRVTGIGGTYVLPQPIAPSEVFYLRWVDDDSPSFDHAMAIDDLTMTFVFSNPPPVIITQPQGLTVNEGSTAAFNVLASGMGDLSYQWTFNTTNQLAGATNSALSLTNVQITDAGVYAVIISNASGMVASSNATLVVNQVPVTVPDTFNRLVGLPFTIKIADMLVNDSDLDGDPLTIIGLSETSTNGALVDRDTTLIYYTPPETNTNVADQFTYTISDGRGGVANATVTIQFAPPLILAGFIGTDGFKVLSMPGVAGVTYLLQVTTNLAAPISWETIATNLAANSGIIEFVDPAATNTHARYYRTVMP